MNGNSHSVYHSETTAPESHRLSNPWLQEFTYESDEDAEELNDVRVGDAVKAAKECVDNGDTGTEDHTRAVVHVDDDAERGACGTPRIILKPEF
jgi:uncharacterized protein YndB with AHSA1/START domain